MDPSTPGASFLGTAHGRASLLWRIGYGALLSFVLLVAYANSLDAPFYLDDLANIVENPFIRFGERNLKDCLEGILREGPIRTRPAAYFSFGLSYLAGGLSPATFRYINLLLHVGSALLLFLLLEELLGRRMPRPEAMPVAAGAATLWALHPAAVSTVVYVVQRMNGGMVFFLLLSLYLAARSWRCPSEASGKRTVFRILSGGALLLSFGFKEIAVVFPYLLFLSHVCLREGEAGLLPLARDPVVRRWGPVLAVAGVAGVAIAAWAFYPEYARYRDFSLGERLLTQPRVLMRYLSLFAFPLPGRFSLEYDFPVSRGFFDPPGTAIALAVLCVAAGAGAWAFRKDRVVAFAIFWFLVTLVPESSVLPLEIIFEHRLYLPMAGLSVLVAWGLFRCFRSLFGLWGIRPEVPYAAAIFLIAAALFSCTRGLNDRWSSPTTFYREMAKDHPGNPRIYAGWTFFLLDEGKDDEAVRAGREGLAHAAGRRAASALRIRNNLGVALARKGDSAGAIRAWKEVLGEVSFSTSRSLLLQVYYNLGTTLLEEGRSKEARVFLVRASEIGPEQSRVFSRLGELHRAEGRPLQAVEAYRKALALDGSSREALRGLGDALYEAREWEEASAVLGRISPDPGESGAALYRLLFRSGYAHMRTGDLARAERDYLQAATLVPGSRELEYNLACLYSLSGDPKRGLPYLENALKGGIPIAVAARDPDLAALRKLPGYARIRGKTEPSKSGMRGSGS